MSIKSAAAEIQAKYGTGACVQFGTEAKVIKAAKKDVIPTGLPSLDWGVLGHGGFVRGRMAEIYGIESAGKTTLCSQIVASAQRLGIEAGYIDAEYAYDMEYASRLGVDMSNLLFAQPDYGQQGIDMAEIMLKSGVGLVIIDSVASLIPKEELDGEMTDSSMGRHPLMMSKACRKLTPVVGDTGGMVIWINQIRMKVGVIMGSPEFQPGGQALKFYASYRLDMRVPERTETHNIVAITAKKNKAYIPYKKTQLKLTFGDGFDPIYDTLVYAQTCGAVTLRGSNYYLDKDMIGAGKDKAAAAMKDNAKLLHAVQSAIAKQHVGS